MNGGFRITQSLPLTREVDFCVSKKTEGEKKHLFTRDETCFAGYATFLCGQKSSAKEPLKEGFRLPSLRILLTTRGPPVHLDPPGEGRGTWGRGLRYAGGSNRRRCSQSRVSQDCILRNQICRRLRLSLFVLKPHFRTHRLRGGTIVPCCKFLRPQGSLV